MSEPRPFIDAVDNRLVSGFFYRFSRFLAKRTFKQVWIQNEYGKPSAERSTLYFGNHNSWWDALTPLILNNAVFHQRPRAVMEWEQVQRYGFFRRIGCFSIDRSDPRSALKSLLHGVNWLNEEGGRSLFFYPEGKITHPQLSTLQFETGIGWMTQKLEPHVDLVPLVQHSHAMHHHKPSLFIGIGKPVETDRSAGKKEITQRLKEITESNLGELRELASPKTPELEILL